MDTLTAARRFFGDLVAASVGATDPRIADVFAKVPREDFLGTGPWLTYVGDSDEAIATPRADVQLLRLAPEQPDETCWLAGKGWWLSIAEA